MDNGKRLYSPYKLLTYGFLAGFVGTLTFHQLSLWLMWKAGIAPFGPYNMSGTLPWGIPAVISLALWGGVWGVLFALILSRFERPGNYWGKAFGFGAVFPSLVALLIVAPIKGHPMGGGWHWPLLLTVFLINGMWGIGTGVLLSLFLKISRSHRLPTPECGPGVVCGP